jgi:uncharacterized protein
MNRIELADWEEKFHQKVADAAKDDPAHDIEHVRRVVRTAERLAIAEKARLDVVIPGAWLHDLVMVPKTSSERALASRRSALEACDFLRGIGYPAHLLSDISRAIEAHSFSANIEPITLEAKIVQDADRLDALGAVGIARAFATGGRLGQQFYQPNDPFARGRTLDEGKFTIDHFETKLFKIARTLHTEAARAEGQRRVTVMEAFLKALQRELQIDWPPEAIC